ncbi:MAG: hypothetical protein QM610_00765 [Chitinophagaceae bacterium]
MKKRYIIVLLSYGLLYSNTNKAQTHVTTTTQTVNGKTVTITSSGKSNDTTGWKTREITKDFDIGSNIPIFIESSFRGITVKTWDQPNVRIVANARYKDDKDATLSFDEVFEKSDIKIRNSSQAFEILGASGNRFLSGNYSYIYTDDAFPKGESFRRSPIKTTTIIGSDKDTSPISITANTFSFSGDSVIFSNDSNSQQQIKIFMKQKENAAKLLEEQTQIAEKANTKAWQASKERNQKRDEAQKAKTAALSKQIEALSKKLAALAIQDADKNSKEITKLNQEIGKLSNQLSVQSIEHVFAFKPDTSKWVIGKPLTINFSGPISMGGSSFGSGNSFSTVDDNFSGISFPKNGLKWTIYIPKNHKLSIDSKYGNVSLDNDLDNAKIVSKYGNIETKNVDNLTVRNEYGNVYTLNVKDADIELRSGKLKMQNAENLKIDSRNASVDLEEVGNIRVESSNDNYDITSVKELNANKNYGSFRLTTLNGKMQFNGVNSDIKIRNIAPSVSNIDITNKFAKIALPFTDIKNYNISVNGNYNSTFDDFTKKVNGDNGFTASGGSGSGLTTNINCSNCQLDFK